MNTSKYLTYPTQAHGAIPAFHSYEEEAAWWDETDTGEPEIEAAMTPCSGVIHHSSVPQSIIDERDSER